MYVADLSEEELVEGASVLGGGATCRHRRGDHALNINKIMFVLFIQCYSVICRPSDHTGGRLRAKIRSPGRSRGRDTNQ